MKRGLLLLLFLFCFRLFSQTYHVKKFTTENGLLSNEISTIYQDKHGILWFGSGHGLAAYDGKNFKNFLLHKHISFDNLPYENDKGLTFTGVSGIVKANYFEMRIIPVAENYLYSYDPSRGASRQNKFYTDKDGYSVLKKHAGTPRTADTLFYFLDSPSPKSLIFSASDKQKFQAAIYYDNHGEVWVGIFQDADEKKPERFSLYVFQKGTLVPLIIDKPSFGFSTVFHATNGDVWLVYADQLCRIRGKEMRTFAIERGYHAYDSPTLTEDKQGRIWLGNYKGLICIDKEKLSYIPNPKRVLNSYVNPVYDKNGTMRSQVFFDDLNFTRLIACDSKGRIVTGNEIFVNGNFITLKNIPSYCSSIYIDREDNIWYAGSDGLVMASPYPVDKVFCRGTLCYVSPDSTISLSVESDRLRVDQLFLYKNGKLSDSLSHGAVDPLTTIQAASAAKGTVVVSCDRLYFVNDGRFREIKPQKTPAGKMIHRDIAGSDRTKYQPRLLCTDSHGNVWGTTASDGMLFSSDGAGIRYYGNETGIHDTILGIGFIDIPLPKSDYLFGSSGVYDLINSFRKIGPFWSGNEVRISPIKAIGNGQLYHSRIYGKIKRDTFILVNPSGLTGYKMIKQDDFPVARLRHFVVHNDSIVVAAGIQTPIAKLAISEKNKTISIRSYYMEPEYVPYVPFIVAGESNFVMIQDAGPVLVYPRNMLNGDSLIHPVVLKPFANFLEYVVGDRYGNYYSTNSERTTIKISGRQRLNDPSLPVTSILRLSYKDPDSLPALERLIEIPFNSYPVEINYKAVNLKNGEKLFYRYRLAGLSDEWTETKEDLVVYNSLPVGSFTFEVMACNENKVWGQISAQRITVLPPWYRTWWAYGTYVIAAVFSVFSFTRYRTRALENDKLRLEETVEKRTIELKEQKQVIEEKHKEITDSINYAERIQKSFLATKELLDENLHEYFVLFRPKDVVSGDFYWGAKLNNGHFALITADSTGHGVPGAIMSLLNITSLEKAIEIHTDPAEILNATRRTIINRLKKDGSAEGGKDGMDCSLICFDLANMQVKISAAHNPVWIVRDKELLEIKADKMPVGKHDRDTEPFTCHTVEIRKGDVIYALTDGFPDQFGGPKGKKFMSKNLKDLLLNNSHLPMHEQRSVLETTFSKWCEGIEQVDDVTVIGIKV